MRNLVWPLRRREPRGAFLLGVREYRTDVTSNPGEHLIEAYDCGREVAHIVTLRRFDGGCA